MDADDIAIRIITRVEREAVKALYQQAGWWEAGDETPGGNSWIDDMVRGSFCFVGAFSGDRMIGMGRAISDGASDAYIQDVTVQEEFRGRGIGARIVRVLSEHLCSRGIGWIGLVAEPGTQPFYRRLGFEVMEGHVLMRRHEKNPDSCLS
ncbi:MAG: GNAT family N-acetyltransferase [Candidatus Aminicenantes bacterium]|nr:GNAT family N-acetyltransferase [Candidatus Aminicenantes bacterium]